MGVALHPSPFPLRLWHDDVVPETAIVTTILFAGLGLALLYAGGEALVRGAAGLAIRLGISALAVGLTVVAFGTSAPELVVSLDAAVSGVNDIAVGNVVGSNICNIALILGLAALIRPAVVHAKLLRLDTPLVVGTSLALLLLIANDRLSRPEGVLLLTGVVAYTVFTFWQSRRESRAVQQEFAEAVPQHPYRVAFDLGLVLGGLGALVAGARLLVSSGVAFASFFGVSEAVIGLTIVAVGTSLPELATSVVAASRGQGDIAVGNVVGSNLFNLLGILGMTAIVHPLDRGGIGWEDLGAMTGVSVLLLILLWSGKRLSRWEGAVLLVIYVGYVAWLVGRQ